MKDWKIIPEVVGCNATLRMAAMQAMGAVELERHFVVEGETGSGRRLLARSAWCRRKQGSHSLFVLDCRMCGDVAEALLFGDRSSSGANTTIQLGKLNLAMGGGLLLLNAEFLPLQMQRRLADSLDQYSCRPRKAGIQLLMTCAPSFNAPLPLHPDLAGRMLRVRLPALRERVEDIPAIAEAFLRNVSPFERIRCSQALIDKFCAYDWPGNVTELHTILRRLVMEPHYGILDVDHLSGMTCRDEMSFVQLQSILGLCPPAETSFIHHDLLSDGWELR